MKKLFIASVCFLALFLLGCQVREAPVGEAVQPPESSEEVLPQVEVMPTISVVAVPSFVKEGELIRVSWKIESEKPLTATHTAIHYDVASYPGVFTTEIGPQASGYPSLTKEYASGEFPVPDEFLTSFNIPEGADRVYFRAHTIIEGNNYWTDEKGIGVEKVIKYGCDYDNPPCNSGYRCQDNECVRIRSGGGY